MCLCVYSVRSYLCEFKWDGQFSFHPENNIDVFVSDCSVCVCDEESAFCACIYVRKYVNVVFALVGEMFGKWFGFDLNVLVWSTRCLSCVFAIGWLRDGCGVPFILTLFFNMNF